jgi:hypothetical protein
MYQLPLYRLREQAPLLLAALWWGSLTTIGFLVVPMLFAYLPTLAQAGGMAAKLFTAQTSITVVCGVLLLLLSRGREGDTEPTPLSHAVLALLAGLLFALLQEFVVAPRIVMRENLALWHRVGSGMYFVQWVCATWTLWTLGSSGASTQD